MNTPPHNPKTFGAAQAPQKSNAPIGNTRVLHRFDFPDGGRVEITVTRDVDALLALEVIETTLPSLKIIEGMTRRSSVSNVSEPAGRTEEIEDE